MNILIIEDEALLARELQATLEEVDATIKVMEIIPSLKVARKWFMENAEPDIVFMDIQLSDGISFALFEDFSLNCPVVFTTAYDQYALKAFQVHGVDYLLKPVMREELKKALEKCRVIIESRSAYPTGIKELLEAMGKKQAGGSQFKEKFIVQFRNQWMPVNAADIACFYKDNLHYIYTFSGEKHILSFQSMEEIEALLDPSIFYRANRQCILNIDAIQSVKPHENSKLTITMKAPLKMEVDISRDKAPQFRKWIDR